MKKLLYININFICLSFVACFDTKMLSDKPTQAGTTKGNAAIELIDGTVITGNTIEIPETSNIDFSNFDPLKRQVANNWIAIDNRKVPKDSIYGIKDNGVYKALYKDVLMTRLQKGKMNLYFFEKKVENGGTPSSFPTTYYVYEKSRGAFKLIVDKLDLFYEAISDHAAAASLCKELFPYLQISQMLSSKDKLIQVVKTYNQ